MSFLQRMSSIQSEGGMTKIQLFIIILNRNYTMELQSYRTFCHCLLSAAELQQEQYANKSIANHAIQTSSKTKQSFPQKDVFSFKLQEHRSYERSDKINNFHMADSRNIRLKSAEMTAYFTERIGVNSPSTRNQYFSPIIKEPPHLHKSSQPSTKKQQNMQTLTSPKYQQPKVVFHFSAPTQVPNSSKMAGKRLRTNEQQTQYSSKHSQIMFKTSNEIPQNLFQRKDGRKKVVFNQCSEQQIIQSEQALQTISQRMFSSQEQDHSNLPLIENYHNGPTMQTIVTSTQIKSRNSSRFSNQLRMLREVREEQLPPKLSFDAHNQQNNSINASPKACLSPREGFMLPNDPSLFEGSARQNISSRISVLSLSKHQEEEELRDVIDHNFLLSQQCSRHQSPKVSLNPSLKNVSSEHQHSERPLYLSPFHSRQSSWQMGPLMRTQAQFRRTNTIQSIQSLSSQMISCLDIKFMQKNRGRRGVSRLL